MRTLHRDKRGAPFGETVMELSYARQPPNWRPDPEAKEDRYGHKWEYIRCFWSRTNAEGHYEQWFPDFDVGRMVELPETAFTAVDTGAVTLASDNAGSGGDVE